jgi:hypothetical protein
MQDAPKAQASSLTERATPWIIAVSACTLLAVGVGLAFTDRAASAGGELGASDSC